ncbi:MAG: replication factor C large subunit [Candidatus Hadarchaeales archaeon]
MTEIWVDKHSPKSLAEVVGQAAAIEKMKAWAREWKKKTPAKKALLLYGPPGTGKTISAILLAKEMGWEYVEMNASDERTLSAVRRIAGEASRAGTLFEGAAGRRLLIIDEADNIHGTADRGGYAALREILNETRNPIILIANDLYAVPADIRALCLPIVFRRIQKPLIVKRLATIAQREKIRADQEALEMIANISEGDMRSAIHDLQVAAFGKKTLTKDDVIIARRNREKTIFDALSAILGSKSAKIARTALWDADLSPDEAFAWIVENVPKVVKDPESLVKVYEVLSKADKFFGYSRSSYKFWSFASDMMTAGVAVSKGEELQFSKFQPSSWIRKMAQTMKARNIRNSVAKKLARKCHTSSRVVKKDFLPYIPIMLGGKPERLQHLARELELNEEEIEFLKSLRAGKS